MNKVTRSGKVAVLYSPGYGTGWYMRNCEYPAILYDPLVVAWVENDKPTADGSQARLEATLEEKYPNIYLSGLRQLRIRWVPVGTRFCIHDYDGSEAVVLVDTELDIQVA